jgi:hypothetical protein
VEQDQHSKALGSYEPDTFKGTIDPNSEQCIPIQLVCEKLGNVNLPVFVRISGSDKPPLVVTLVAVARGATVELDQDRINWGNVTCLTDTPRFLTLHNTALIPARFRAFVSGQRSNFSVDFVEGVMPPGASQKLTLTACLDDTINHKDTLSVLIEEGEHLQIPLLARGIGTTLACDRPLENVEFGPQFTARPADITFFLENKGRRVQSISWVNVTQRTKEQSVRAMDGKRKKGKKKDEHVQLTASFIVTPDAVTLEPRTGCYFTLRAENIGAGLVSERLVCESKVGKDKVLCDV